MSFVLYYSPGACSLAINISVREAGLPLELVKVDLRTKKLATGEDYLAINPNGYVPSLRLPDGSVFTEAAVVMQLVADQKPEVKLAPPIGSRERYRFMELVHFIATELHKGGNPLFSPVANDEYKTQIKERLASRWTYLQSLLRDGYLFGGGFTVVDAYAFYVLRSWQRAHKQDLARWPALAEYYTRLAARPTVVAALASEGIEA